MQANRLPGTGIPSSLWLTLALLLGLSGGLRIHAQFGCNCCEIIPRHFVRDSPSDLDGDGVIDVTLRRLEDGLVTYCVLTARVNFTLQTPYYAEFLMEEASKQPWPLHVGDTLGETAPAGAAWRSSISLLQLTIDLSAQAPTILSTGFLASRTNALVGLRFRSALGTHYGWLKLENQLDGDGFSSAAVTDTGFHYQPATAIAVGTKPPAPPPDPQSVTNYVGVFLERPFDARLRRREWTNTATVTGGYEVHLDVQASAKVLVANPNSSFGLFDPVEVVPGRRVPASPPVPQGWAEPGLIPLLRVATVTEASGATKLIRSGLLTDGPKTFALMSTNQLNQQPVAFPVHLDTNGTVTTIERNGSAYPVVGSQGYLGSDEGGLDLNGDGRVDFIRRRKSAGSHLSLRLEPIGSNRIVSKFVQVAVVPVAFPTGKLVSPNLDASDSQMGLASWNQSPAYAYLRDLDPNQLPVTAGLQDGDFIAISFETAAGRHYGWLRWFSGQVIDYDFNPEPGQPLAAGTRKAMKGPSLRFERRTDGKLWLVGNAVGSLWRQKCRNGLLNPESWSDAFFPQWIGVGESLWRFEQVVAPTNTSGFYRFEIPGLAN